MKKKSQHGKTFVASTGPARAGEAAKMVYADLGRTQLLEVIAMSVKGLLSGSTKFRFIFHMKPQLRPRIRLVDR